MKKGTLKSNDGQTTIHFTDDTTNVQMLKKLILSFNQLCMLLSVVQTFDDQPSLSYVAERDLDVSEMETLRQPPLDPVAHNAGRRPHAENRRHDQW